tara:strand:- start:488 stop:1195 length:708 start_codon:yes stop_codon:yes gene_type:complete
MGSSRFPGKPLKKINGKPMIQHVYENVKKNKLIRDLAVATCDKKIFNFVKSFDGNAVMTSKKHKRASDRCAEALIKIERKNKIKYDFIVMVQGDEPMVHKNMISESLRPILKNRKIKVVNLYSEIKSKKEFTDVNCIKVVCSKKNNALYFSRKPIPYFKSGKFSLKKQVCIIPFQRDFLIQYIKMKPTPLEIAESVDMMRILENGFSVYMAKTKYKTQSVDTIKDLKKVEKLIKK